MELRDYLKIIKKHYLLILIITVLVGLSTFIFSLRSPVTYDTSLSLFIARSTTQNTQDYKYDGYYAIKAAELFSDTIKQWLEESPEVIMAIYNQAGVDLESKSLRKIRKIFMAYKMSSQYIEVRFKAKTKPEARNIAQALPSVLQNKTKNLTWTTTNTSFDVQAAEPVIIEDKPKPILNSLMGLISGFVLGVFIVFFKEYYRKD